MLKRTIGFSIGMALATAAQAQQARYDPRTVQEVAATYEAMVALREKEMATMRLDYEARLNTAMEWLKAAQAAPAPK